MDTISDDRWEPEQFARRLRRKKHRFWGGLLIHWLLSCGAIGFALYTERGLDRALLTTVLVLFGVLVSRGLRSL